MNGWSAEQMLLLFLVMAPGVVFAGGAIAWLIGWESKETTISRITQAAFGSATLATVALFVMMARSGHQQVVLPLGDWFRVHEYSFPVILVADRLSMPFVGLTVVLAGLIGYFSSTYLHRESGYVRFFLLLDLFAFGALLIFTAGSFDLMVGGWELVGITSVMLISFFHDRPAPVDNALRVFGVYRACDIGLLVAIVAMHHWAETASFANGPVHLHGAGATVVGLLLLVAASGKSAQAPFTGWLPRAMEGPTPSSAIFYGAISVHAGAYLLLRSRPMWEESLVVALAIGLVGLATAVVATLSGRAAADVKASLAFASAAQVGVVFIEIAAGWETFAIIHILGHACVRTLQFLRAPSMMRDFHQQRSGAGGQLQPTGRHMEGTLPARLQLWMYRFAMDRGHMDTLIDKVIGRPLFGFSKFLGKLDSAGGGWREAPPVPASQAPAYGRERALDA